MTATEFFSNKSRPKLAPTVVKVLPGVRATLRQSITIKAQGQDIQLPAHEQVLVQCTNTGEFLITPFKDDKKSHLSVLKEGKRNIEADTSRQGVMNAADGAAYFAFSENYQLSDKPLFSNDDSPSIADIKQGYIPDCFLLSAIQSILNHPNGRAFIQNMMRRVSEDMVEVRLFKPIKDADDKVTHYEPVYVQVPAATLQTKAGDLSLHPALWVHALELAYAAIGVNGPENRTVDASVSSAFNQGGSAAVAMSILTGLETKAVTVEHHFDSPWDAPRFFGENLADMRDMLEMFAEVIPVDELQEKQFNFIYGAIAERLPRLHAFVEHDVDAELTAAIQKDSYSETNANRLRQYVNYMLFYFKHEAACRAVLNHPEMSHPEKLYTLASLASAKGQQLVGDYLLAWAKHEFVPNEAGHINAPVDVFSAHYNADAMAMYHTLESALAAGQLVAMGTKQTFAKPMVGIAPTHAYTVLGVEMRVPAVPVRDVDGNIVSAATPHVRLRNPWGMASHSYDVKDGKVIGVKDEDAESVLDLNDFMAVCSSVYSSVSANALFQYEAQKQQVQAAMAQVALDSHFHKKSLIAELVLFNQQFHAAIRPVIKLERFHLAAIPPALTVEIEAMFEASRDDEQAIVEAKLAAVVFPVLPLKQDRQAEYVYLLLKHRWLERQVSPDVLQCQQLETQIIQLCPHDFMADIKRQKLNHDLFLAPMIHTYEKTVEHFKLVMAKINEKLDDNTEMDILSQLDDYVLYCHELNNVRQSLLALHVDLKCYGYAMSDDDLHQLDKDAQALIDFFDGVARKNKTRLALLSDVTTLIMGAALDGVMPSHECQQLLASCEMHPDLMLTSFNIVKEQCEASESTSIWSAIYQKLSALATLTWEILSSIRLFKSRNVSTADTMFDDSLLIKPTK